VRSWGNAGVWILLLAGSFLQQPGRTTFDTKFDLTAGPAALLERALNLWNPSSFGGLGNQAYGYLIPQGPFFLGAELLSVPDWVAQRLWSALLLVAAYEGTRRVGRALGIPVWAAGLGGLGYALAPRMLGAVGVLSSEVLPTAVLPWVVLPLVLALTGRLAARRAGLLSGVAILFMGGVNATATLAALPLALLIAATRLRHRGGRALLGWWALGTVLACAWWIGPLLLLGRYSPPFLDFIETAAATTSPTGWANSLRGADHWVAFISVNGQDWWPGARLLVTSGFLAVLAMAVTAFGLIGLLHARMPLRLPLALSLVLGLLLLTVGNPSAAGSLVDEPVRALLDGPLAALRNVHKVDPLVRLPVALGIAHAAALVFERAHLVLTRRAATRHLPVARRVVVGTLVMLLVAGAPPLLTNGLRTPGWTDVPEAWAQAADYLGERPDSRALVVPGAGFGLQTWGWTIDEPIQGLAESSWVTRSQVPLIPGQTARVLDAVEARLANGQGGPGLSAYLARAGITHVVLRRDLDPAVAETAATDRVERALGGSPGLSRVADFGRTGFGDQPLITVYRVPGAEPRATLVGARDVVTLDGGPEDVLAALDAGAISAGEPVLVQSSEEPADLVTDGYRRVERQFGRSHDSVSEVMTGSAPYRTDRPAHDYPGAPTVRAAAADYVGLDAVSASTSPGYPDIFGPVLPARGPAAAFDGRLDTSWRSAPFVPPVGQWLHVDLEQPIDGGVLQVSFVDTAGSATVRQAAVAFDGVPRIYGVPDGGQLMVPVPSTEVHDVRISVVSVAPGALAGAPVAIAEVDLPETTSGRTLDVPRSIGAETTVLLGNQAPRRACVDIGYGPHCETSEIRTTEWNGFDRQLHVVEAGSWDLSGTVVADAGAAAAALLGPLGAESATVTSDSVFGGDPAVSGVFAFDGLAGTPWLADPGDSQATLHLRWTGERTIGRLVIDPAHVPAAEPIRARIESSAGVRMVDLRDFGLFEPLRARDGLSITLYRPASAEAGLPLGAGEIRIGGLEGLEHAPLLDRPTTTAVCGLGPEVRVDGTAYRTEVTGTLRDVVAGTPMTWRICDGPVELAPGVHRVVAGSTAQFQPVSLIWRPVAERTRGTAEVAGDRLEIASWTDARRVVSVTGGPAAILRIPENVNPGWRATLDGAPLEPVVLDGWQQGYRIPTGSAGDVVIEFAPDPWYRGALLAGLALAVALLALATGGVRRPRADRGVVPVSLASPTRVLGVGTALAVGLAGLVLGGVPLAVGWAAGLVPPVRRYATALGVVALVASGVLVATSAGLDTGRPGTWADATAAFGLGLLLALVVRVRRPRIAGWRGWRIR
jgi:arabinofuranan 3-O-arabinosyltransferase